MNHTQAYVTALQKEFASGIAAEHAYRPALKTLIESVADKILAVNDPKRQTCGAPDYIVRKGEIDVGYVEAKDIGIGLDKVEKSDQMKRYLASLDNLILTDYLEFRFYVNQQKVAAIRIAEVDDFFAPKPSIKPIPENFAQLASLLANFVEYTGQTIKSAKSLAEMMARKAQLMRDVFQKTLEQEERSSLHDQMDAFKQILIHDMDAAQFADVYAQTIAYGLFTARLHDQTLEDFSRQEARELIPRSNPFLRRLFDYVCGAELDTRVVWIVDALCEVYRAADVHSILHSFGRATGRNDPIVHFYEDFLGAYDAKLRKARGVWYTPEPVVNFIVRAVDEVLQSHFGLPDGLADTSKVTIEVEVLDNKSKTGKRKEKQQVHKVQLLDVAAGTGTFTAEAIKQIHARFAGQQGMWSQYVEEHLLPRLHGFEILMASYAMCHLKIDLLLTELGYKPSNPTNPPRLGVYLTNALEEHHPDTGTLFASWLAHEANEASRIKKDMPIMVAYGNPPYSVSSQNKGTWIQNLIADYKTGLKEKKLNLDDDYIKFIRYAEHYIEKTGYGVVAMITNNSFLDGVTHRQMRKHLLETFDHIYIYDLHGSAKKKETSPDGSPDKNVFDIMQGVSISILVKDGSRKEKLAEVKHFDSYGSRQGKYQQLWEHSLKTAPFAKLEYKEPYYFFVPKDFGNIKKYQKGFSTNALFLETNSGIQTKRDSLVYQFEEEGVLKAIDNVTTIPAAEVIKLYDLPPDNAAWSVSSAKEDLEGNNFKISRVEYKPFDFRWTAYTGKSSGFMARPRAPLSKQCLRTNICFLSVRNSRRGNPNCYFLSIYLVDKDAVSPFDNVRFSPLYLYPDTSAAQENLEAQPTRKPNLDAKIVAEIAAKLAIPFVPDHEDKASDDHSCFTPLDLLDYIYAVLHSPRYRDTYKEFLKIDFPRIPYPADVAIFWKLVALGGDIRRFHLLEHPALAKPLTTFPESGDCVVEKPTFKDGRVSINATQYFDHVPEVAWNFHIGGYQPAQKWLKDRKTRLLSFDDIRHYQKIIVALVNTDRLMKEIDKAWKG